MVAEVEASGENGPQISSSEVLASDAAGLRKLWLSKLSIKHRLNPRPYLTPQHILASVIYSNYHLRANQSKMIEDFFTTGIVKV